MTSTLRACVSKIWIASTMTAWALASSLGAFAQSETTEEASTRSRLRTGIYLGVLAEPMPSGFSINGAYNVTESLRVIGGIGDAFVATTYGAGLRYIASPEKDFSLAVGAHLARTKLNDPLDDLFVDLGVGSLSFWSIAVSAGVDWQLSKGFNLGVGLQTPIWVTTGKESTGFTFLLPYLTLGFFF